KQLRKDLVKQDDPAIRRLESKLETQKDSLEQARKDLIPVAEAAFRNRIGETGRQDLDITLERIAYWEAYKKALQGDVDRLNEAAKQLNEGALNLDDFKDEREHAAKMAARFAEDRDKLQADLEAPSRVKILEEARIERVEETPRKLRFTALAALGGLAITLLAVAFLEFRRRRLDSPETVSRELGIQIVGTVPACPFNNRRLLGRDAKAAAYWQHLLTDS